MVIIIYAAINLQVYKLWISFFYAYFDDTIGNAKDKNYGFSKASAVVKIICFALNLKSDFNQSISFDMLRLDLCNTVVYINLVSYVVNYNILSLSSPIIQL